MMQSPAIHHTSDAGMSWFYFAYFIGACGRELC